MRRLLLLAVLALAAPACSQEAATPIDLGGGIPATTADEPAGHEPATAEGVPDPGTLPATPHAVGESPQARAYAEQQCLDEPGRDRGVIRIVDPTSHAVVGEVVVDCAAVREGGDAGTPSGP